MNALRKVYHCGIQITLDNVKRLWQELESFETNLNRTTSKKHMQATYHSLLVSYVGAIPPIHPKIFTIAP